MRSRRAHPTGLASVLATVATGLALVVVAGVLLLAGAGRAAAAPAPTTPPSATTTQSDAATTSSPPSAPSVPTTPPGIQVGPPLPAPTSGSGSGPGPTASAGSGGCGLFDVTCHITGALDSWFRDLVTSALNPMLALLGRTVLATPNVTGGKIAALWAVTAGIANALVVLLVLAGGAVVMGHETLQTRYAAKDVAPRIVVGVIAANASLALVRLAIPVANALSQALLGGGADPASAAAALRQMVLAPLGSGGIFLVLLGLVAAVLTVVLLATYVIRVALLVLLVAAAPLALVCHALPQTEGAARLWWRATTGVFAIQLAQSLVLVCALKVFFTSGGSGALGLSASGGLVDVLMAICLLWVLVRIPAWVSQVVFAGTGHNPSAIGRAFKVAVVYKLVRAGTALAA